MNNIEVIYFDNASTTKVDSRVIDVMMPYFHSVYGNPSSSHKFGEKINLDIANASKQISKLLNCKSDEIIYTSGATESINTILKNIGINNNSKRKQIITFSTEHTAVLDTCEYLETIGLDIIYLPVKNSGQIDIEKFKSTISEKTYLVCVMMVNNETGVINPIKEISSIARAYGALIMTDATQAVGKIKLDVADLDVDFLVFSAHKFYGPKGIGGIYINPRSKRCFTPLIHGGGHQNGRRSGTLNVPGIIGLGKASEIAISEMQFNENKIAPLVKFIENQLLEIKDSFINGKSSDRIYNITNICIPGIEADTLIRLLNNICVSSGSACSSSSIEPSYVLKAMGLSNNDAFSSIRFSLGRENTEEEVMHAVQRVKELVKQLNF